VRLQYRIVHCLMFLRYGMFGVSESPFLVPHRLPRGDVAVLILVADQLSFMIFEMDEECRSFVCRVYTAARCS
jgi:hypothetical protein